MSEFIILTPAQADEVRGPTAPGAALYPVEIEDGNFILGVEVLVDPAHAEHHDYLAALPKSQQEDIVFKTFSEDTTKMAVRPRGI